MKYKVEEKNQLLNFLYNNINKSKNAVKNILKSGQVLVNGNIVTAFDYQLNVDDTVEIIKKVNNLDIIYEDKDIIVINKKEGISTIADKNHPTNNLYYQVSEYLKKQKHKVFIIHRLDRDTSGVIMFAKNSIIQKLYQEHWNDLVLTREYYAIVCGHLKNKQGIIDYKLKENKNGFVYVDKNGKEAITEYQVVKENNDYSLLKINLKTGRKNQIRVHMKALNHPIIGDKKYLSSSNPIHRLGLHANKLEIINPKTHKKMLFEAKVPNSFNNLF